MKPAVILVLCCLSMLTAGTLYMFSLYGQQFAARLHYTQTETNFVAIAGNYGMTFSGPLCGWVVDVFGPRRGSLLAAFFLATGYVAMALTYNEMLFSDSFILMSVYFAFVGTGGTFSYMSTISTLAKTFRTNRGVALGVPIAMYGLSALVWTAAGRFLFMGSDGLLDIPALLLFLGAGTCVINVNSAVWFAGAENAGKAAKDVVEDKDARGQSATEVTPLVGDQQEERMHMREEVVDLEGEPDLSGLALFKNLEVWAFVVSLIFLSGPGFMVINSVGAILASLYQPTTTTQSSLAALQSTHVMILSALSSAGRIGGGVVSDFLKRHHISRLWSYIAFGVVMFTAQTIGAAFVDKIEGVVAVTVLTGLAYGGMFSVAPTITAEFWGARRFASNWGWVSLSTALGALVCNLIFGALYDTEAQRQHSAQCRGPACFQRAFFFAAIACLAGLVVAVALSIERRRRKAAAKREWLDRARMGRLVVGA